MGPPVSPVHPLRGRARWRPALPALPSVLALLVLPSVPALPALPSVLAAFAVAAFAGGCADSPVDDAAAPAGDELAVSPERWHGWRDIAPELVADDDGIRLDAIGGGQVYVTADGRVFRSDAAPAPIAGADPAGAVLPPSDPVDVGAEEADVAGDAGDSGGADKAGDGAADPRGIIFGTDDRTPYTSTETLTSFNKRTIGRLTIGYGAFGSFTCTGSLVGPRHVVTAAHCLIGPFGMLPQVANVKFSPGERGAGFGTTRPNGALRNVNGYFLRSDNDVWDYALIILEDRPETAALGYMGLRWESSDDWYEDRWISVVGYPGSDQSCWTAPVTTLPLCGGFMYGMQCQIDTADEDLEYECDTTGGHSGGPVYTWLNGSPYVIGVHRGSTSSVFSTWNKGVRFNHTKMGDICSWIGSTPSAYATRSCIP